MLVLRIIEETRENETLPYEQVIENFELGDAYSRIQNGTKEFDKIADNLYPEWEKSEIESIICSENGKTFFVMKKDINNYVSIKVFDTKVFSIDHRFQNPLTL